jgi:hypothetical protein
MSARNSYIGVLVALAAVGCIFVSSVGARTLIYPLAVTLTGVSPTRAAEGQLVTISGTHLESTKQVQFGTVTADSFTVDPGGTWVKAVVPAGVPSGPLQITLDVLGINQSIGPIVIGSGSAAPAGNPQPNGTPQTPAKAAPVVVAPRITRVSPTAGKVGTKVTINGTNLSGATWLKFGGVRAHFKVSSANWIIATVPKHARSGKIMVHTSGGTAPSKQAFKVS